MGGDPHEFVPSERIGHEIVTVRHIGAVLERLAFPQVGAWLHGARDLRSASRAYGQLTLDDY